MPTMRDVAKAAGVTLSTVSHVMNGTAPVSDQTRQKVMEAIERLGYRRVRRRSRKTKLVGIIHGTDFERRTSMILGALSYLQTRGVRALVAVHEGAFPEGRSVDEVARDLGLSDVEGVIVLHGWLERIPGLTLGRLPCVAGMGFSDRGELQSVIPDFFQGARDATRHLLELGHQRILLLNGPHDARSSREREDGYRAAHADAGMSLAPELVTFGAWGAESGYRRMKAVLDQGVEFTALFAGNDNLALGAIDALRERDLRIPHDVAVIGYDNTETSLAIRPALTTVELPLQTIGQVAAKLLLDKIESALDLESDATSLTPGSDHPLTQASVLQVPCPLIVRNSCGASLISSENALSPSSPR